MSDPTPPEVATPPLRTCARCHVAQPEDEEHFSRLGDHGGPKSWFARVCRACVARSRALVESGARARARAKRALRVIASPTPPGWPPDPHGPIRSALCQAARLGEATTLTRNGVLAYRRDCCRESVAPGEHARWCARHAPRFGVRASRLVPFEQLIHDCFAAPGEPTYPKPYDGSGEALRKLVVAAQRRLEAEGKIKRVHFAFGVEAVRRAIPGAKRE